MIYLYFSLESVYAISYPIFDLDYGHEDEKY